MAVAGNWRSLAQLVETEESQAAGGLVGGDVSSEGALVSEGEPSLTPIVLKSNSSVEAYHNSLPGIVAPLQPWPN